MTTAFPNPFKLPPANPVAAPGANTLYQQATGLEKSLADVDAERITAIFAEAIIETWDPWEINYEMLPFLAWAMGVNLWEDWWDETFRRYWVANQWTLKSLRGSRAGLDEFVKAVGGEVKRAITPPARTYPLPRFTDDERAAYVARFPQLRLYPYVAREQLHWLAFMGAHRHSTDNSPIFQRNGRFLPPARDTAYYENFLYQQTPVGWGTWPTVQDAGGKYTRTATLWDRGVEKTLTVRKVVAIDMGPNTGGWGFTPGVRAYDEEVVLPARHRINYYVGQLKFLNPTGRYGTFPGLAEPLRTIRLHRAGPISLTQGKAQYQTVLPDGDFINLYPKLVMQSHPIRPTELYMGKRQFLAPSPPPGYRNMNAKSLAVRSPMIHLTDFTAS